MLGFQVTTTYRAFTQLQTEDQAAVRQKVFSGDPEKMAFPIDPASERLLSPHFMTSAYTSSGKRLDGVWKDEPAA